MNRTKALAITLAIAVFSGCGGAPTSPVGHWEGSLDIAQSSYAVALDIWNESDLLVGTIDSPDMSIYGLPINTPSCNGRTFKGDIQPSRKEKYRLSLELDSATMTGDLDLGTSKGLLKLSRSSGSYIHIAEREIHFRSGSAELVGSLLIPSGSGPHPAVVLAHGSGQWTRSNTALSSRARLFARNGIAAFIYDRQGKGASTGDTTTLLNFSLLTADLRAAVATVRRQTEVDPARVGVSGNSQGAWIAPLAAAEDGTIAFVVVTAAPGITPDEQDLYAHIHSADNRLNTVLAGAKIPEQERSNILEYQNQYLSDLLATETSNTDSAEIVPGVSHVNPLESWGRVYVPVLAIWGEKDELVPALLSRDSISAALTRAGNATVSLKIFPNADHQLRLVGADSRGPWPRTAPGVDSTLIAWSRHIVGLE